MANVSRRDRLIDFSALALIVTGAALYLVARARMVSVAESYSWKNPGPAGAVTIVDQAMYATYAGVALIAAGCLVGIFGAALHVARRRRERAAAVAGA